MRLLRRLVPFVPPLAAFALLAPRVRAEESATASPLPLGESLARTSPRGGAFDEPLAIGAYTLGWAGAYDAVGIGGRARWEFWQHRAGLDLFGEALMVEWPGGSARHDLPIGFNLYVPFALGSRVRVRAMGGFCAVFSFIEPEEAGGPSSNDVLFGVHGGAGLEVAIAGPVGWFLAAKVSAAWGEPARQRCVTCHQPGFGADQGIGCVSCHAATGNLASRDGLLTVDLDAPLSGPFGDPQPTTPHGSRTYGFLESPDLCGTCHDVTGPGLLHETTLDEFALSEPAAKGATCTTCHLPALIPGPIATGATTSRNRADHSFVGVDPPWGATEAEQTTAARRTLRLLRQGLTLHAARANDGKSLEVSVTNVAGHAAPTGAASLRTIWIDVEFTAADGTTALSPAAMVLSAQPTRDGAAVALITQADVVESTQLAASATRSVLVPIPSALGPPVRATVTLRARAIRPEVLEALGLGDRAAEVPTHEIAVGTVD